jgi:hypothetical protein
MVIHMDIHMEKTMLLHMDARINKVFGQAGREQLSFAELTGAGLTAKAVAAAVDAGRLCKGCRGYWLPRKADPGAVAVMRAAMNETHTEEV